MAHASVVNATDFSGSHLGGASQEALHHSYAALFWTVPMAASSSNPVSDVHREIVRDDAVTGFATQMPCWHLNAPLTWYFGMPVYERAVPSHVTKDNREAV